MISQEIEKRKFIKAPQDGTDCDECRKHIKGRGEVLRFSQRDEAGKYEIKFFGTCCAWKY